MPLASGMTIRYHAIDEGVSFTQIISSTKCLGSGLILQKEWCIRVLRKPDQGGSPGAQSLPFLGGVEIEELEGRIPRVRDSCGQGNGKHPPNPSLAGSITGN